jgi:DNA-binding response OmpR family regulator
VLVIASHPVLVNAIELALNHGRFATRTAGDSTAARNVLEAWSPHLVLIDMDLPDSRHLEWLSPADQGATRLPVIALTRRGDLQTKIAAFERGADDILTLPLSPEELLARAMALMRRAYQESARLVSAIQIGELQIDILHRRARVGSRELHLTSLELSLLYLLAGNAGRLLSRDEILDGVWGPDYIAESNVVDRHVRSLRAKLENHAHRPRFIATIAGRGYRFLAAVAVTAVGSGWYVIATMFVTEPS